MSSVYNLSSVWSYTQQQGSSGGIFEDYNSTSCSIMYQWQSASQITGVGSVNATTTLTNGSSDPKNMADTLKESRDSNNGGQTAAIVGGIIGVILVIPLVLFIFFLYQRKRLGKKEEESNVFVQQKQTSVPMIISEPIMRY